MSYPDFQALEAERYQAMIDADLDTLDRLMDDEMVYTHSAGDRETKASYLKRVADGFFDYHSLDFTNDTVVLRGDTATIMGTMKGELTAGGNPRTLNNCCTTVWAKNGGQWKVIAFQPTPILS